MHADAELAQLFSVSYSRTYKVSSSKLAKEQYVLTQCGQVRPNDADAEKVQPLPSGFIRKHFSVPVQSAAALSTVTLAFIDALDVQDRVKYVDEQAVAACWQRALTFGAKLESESGTSTL